MKKIDLPHPPDDDRYIFTEGISYSTTGRESIWGPENPLTLETLKNSMEVGGKWLNLAAGDGRYNNEIANLASMVLATDIDESALKKLQLNTPDKLKSKVETLSINITDILPLQSCQFDGVFSAGTLHLFPESVFKNIAAEISRVLKVGGVMILEFRVNIDRTNTLTGESIKFGDEPLYNRKQAVSAIAKVFPSFEIKFFDGDHILEVFEKANPPFNFSCVNLIITGLKLNKQESIIEGS